MRFTRVAGLVALVALLLAPTGVAARSDGGSCPAGPSGWERVDIEEWWARTVAGFADEGIIVYDGSGDYTEQFDMFAADAGFGDGAGLEFFVRVTQWDAMDKNANEFVCIKDWPNTNGTPAFFFGGVDDSVRP
jgi:hypothetical protein